jgi:EAL domain-containing protein (putative c-di-GMP-specific phosphodiesterase class I)
MQAQMLARMGCDFAQGFHFARPLTPSAALRFLISHRVRDPAIAAASPLA